MRLIDADALQAQIQQDYDLFVDSTYLPDKARRDELSNVLARIVNAPTIEAEPVRRGKWLPHPTDRDYDVCSACGSGTRKRTHGYENGLRWDTEEVYQYCPRCGAKMETADD